MRKAVLVLFTIVSTHFLVSCGHPKPDIIAGSSQIECVVKELRGSDSGIRTLIPPRLCPGHFDVRPSDIEAAANARAFIVHPWQLEMPSVTGLITSAKLPPERIKLVQVQGNWMVPSVQADAARALADILIELEPASADQCRQRAQEYADRVTRTGVAVKGEIDPIAKGLKVVCNEMQTGFVKWAGFEVVSTFGRPEDLSVADLERLVQQGKASGIALIIDNLQSGNTRISDSVVRDTGAEHVILSNFPGGLPETESWEKALRKNVALLLEAAQRWKSAHA